MLYGFGKEEVQRISFRQVLGLTFCCPFCLYYTPFCFFLPVTVNLSWGSDSSSSGLQLTGCWMEFLLWCFLEAHLPCSKISKRFHTFLLVIDSKGTGLRDWYPSIKWNSIPTLLIIAPGFKITKGRRIDQKISKFSQKLLFIQYWNSEILRVKDTKFWVQMNTSLI